MASVRSKTVQSVDRAISLLRTLAEAGEELSVGELAARCRLERPTAWRLLWTLESNGLIQKTESAHAYKITRGWLTLPPLQTVDSLVRVSRPVLRELASEQHVTASLVYLQRLTLEYVDQVDGDLFTSPRWESQALSPHASSPGKAVLAALPETEWRGMVGPTLVRLTPTTITSMSALEEALRTVRAQGYATCEGEDVTYSNGASAAIRASGQVIGAVDLWGPDRMVPSARLDELGRAAVAGARRIEGLFR